MLSKIGVRASLSRTRNICHIISSRRSSLSLEHKSIEISPSCRFLFSSSNRATGKRSIVYRNVRLLATGPKKTEKFILPDIGEGISEVVIKDWLVKTGDVVKEFDGICDVESDKATATISSRFEGVVTKRYYELGEMAKVGQPLVDIEVNLKADDREAQPQKSANLDQPKEASNTINSASATIQTLPSVRRLAREKDINLSEVVATGKHGRILKEDVLAYLEQPQSTKAGASCTASTSSIDVNSGRKSHGDEAATLAATTTLPFTGIQRAMFKTMTQSLKIPHFGLKYEIDLTLLVEASARRNSRGKPTDKVSNLSFIIKMVSMALKEYSTLNASISDDEDKLIIKHYHNIGIAVDTPSGLIVPNIKNVQNLSILEINSELLRLRELAYAGKLGPSDLSGGTITLSNIGAIGGVVGIPVIVTPEILIGALGEIRKLPRYNKEGQLEARHIMELNWSADHRVVDGATLSRFSNLLRRYLEEPDLPLLKLC